MDLLSFDLWGVNPLVVAVKQIKYSLTHSTPGPPLRRDYLWPVQFATVGGRRKNPCFFVRTHSDCAGNFLPGPLRSDPRPVVDLPTVQHTFETQPQRGEARPTGLLADCMTRNLVHESIFGTTPGEVCPLTLRVKIHKMPPSLGEIHFFSTK